MSLPVAVPGRWPDQADNSPYHAANNVLATGRGAISSTWRARILTLLKRFTNVMPVGIIR